MLNRQLFTVVGPHVALKHTFLRKATIADITNMRLNVLVTVHVPIIVAFDDKALIALLAVEIEPACVQPHVIVV